MTPTPRQEILAEASRITANDRNVDYDEPERNFGRIAALFSVYLEKEIKPHDVAVLMMLTKVARIMTSPGKRDHWVDSAGYAACGWDAHINTTGSWDAWLTPEMPDGKAR